MDDLLRLLVIIGESLADAVPPAVRATVAAAPHLLLWGAGISAGLCGGILLAIIGVRLLQAVWRGVQAVVAQAPSWARAVHRRLTWVRGVSVGVGMLVLYAGTLAWHASPLRSGQPRRPPRSTHRGEWR